MMRRPTGRTIGLGLVCFLLGVGVTVATEEPAPTQPMFDLPAPNRIEVTDQVKVMDLPRSCENLIESALAYHKVAMNYSALSADAEILLERMRGAVASRDIQLLDKLTREYELLWDHGLSNDPATGDKGAGKRLYEVTDMLKTYSQQCEADTEESLDVP